MALNTPPALLAAVLLAGSPATLGAQTSDPVAAEPGVAEALEVARVWLEAQRDYDEVPGVSAALVHDQEILWSGGYGEAHPERGVPATSETVYSICSISKLFTAIALMQLRDDGLIELSDPVREHLPWFTLEETFPGAPSPTVEGILTHSAGLPREADLAYWSTPDLSFPTREEIIEGVSRQETLYRPWRHFQYSNLGLTLAGEIVRALSGQPYDAYVRSRVLGPLGLDDTWSEMPEEHRGGRLATGYSDLDRDAERTAMPFFQARGLAPAAGFASTVDDLARFASWQFRLEGDAEEVLHAHTLQEMQRVHYVDPEWDTFWGLGFSVRRHDDETLVGHGGSCPGYRSQLVLDMDDEVAVVLMANASGVDTGTYVNALYDLVAPRVKAAVARREDSGEPAEEEAAAASRPDPAFDDYLGAYSRRPYGGELAVVRWDGGLAMLSLPSRNPARGLRKLRHVEGDTFRRVRGDDELGETITFLRDEEGEVVAYEQFRQVSPKIR